MPDILTLPNGNKIRKRNAEGKPPPSERYMEMKATGIVRRIDDLGRVVIPKEIRRTMRIREGDPLEIYTDREGEVIFKKYSPIGELNSFAAQYADTLSKTCDLAVVVCDRDAVITSSGVSRKEFADRHVSDTVERLMENRGVYLYAPGENAFELIADGNGKWLVSCLAPILAEGDVIGAVATLFPYEERSSHRPSETESKLILTAASFLGKQMED